MTPAHNGHTVRMYACGNVRMGDGALAASGIILCLFIRTPAYAWDLADVLSTQILWLRTCVCTFNVLKNREAPMRNFNLCREECLLSSLSFLHIEL